MQQVNTENELKRIGSILENMSFPTVREWKKAASGRKVAGFFPVYGPFELAHALDILPVGIYGAGGAIEIDHADSRIQSFVCSIARSTLELGLTDNLKDFDAIFLTSICDVARNLSGIWTANFSGQHADYIHYPQNAHSASAVEYYRAELQRILEVMERISGRKATAEMLNASIRKYNRNRELCRKLYQIKRDYPGKLTSVEAYQFIRYGTVIPVEEHNELLEAVIPTIEARPDRQRDYVRVVLEGSFCEQPPLELIQTIEEAGCALVEDDMILNSRWFLQDVPITDDPVRALAESYLSFSVSSSVRHPGTITRKARLIEKVQATKADGVIFAAPKFCEPALLDYVLFKDELEKAKIPYLSFEYEEKMGVYESIKMQTETFVESVMFFL